MIQKTGVALRFYAFYTASKVGKTGLTVTVDVYENGVAILTGASASEIGGGFYSYTLAAGSNDANGEYAVVFKTSDGTVDFQHVPSMWTTPAWLTSLGTATVTFSGPNVSTAALELVRGDDYNGLDRVPPTWSSTTWPNLTGATVTFTVRPVGGGSSPLSKPGALVSVGGSPQTVKVELTSAETQPLKVGTDVYGFDVEATLSSGRKVTLVRGLVTILEDFTR